MNTFFVREAGGIRTPLEVQAKDECEAVKNLIAQGRWYAYRDTAELINVTTDTSTQVVLLPDGAVLEVGNK